MKLTNQEVIDAWSAADSARDFGEEGDFGHQHLLNPAIFLLLQEAVGDLSGARILDGGCGQGYLARLLAKRGALVTAVEPAESLFRQGLEREREERLGISFLQADLSFLTGYESTFDAVVANMVFMDIPDYEAAIQTCISCLKPGGSLIFSLLHPCFEEPGTAWATKGYVEVREYLAEFQTRQSAGYLFHRPLSSYINLVSRAGCILQRMLEPGLCLDLTTPATPRERAAHVPYFIVMQAVRASISQQTNV